MKLNFHQAWHYHYIAKIKQPFKLWLKTKKQGKMQFFGEVYCKRYKDCPQGLYQIAIRHMSEKGKCRFWEYKEESKEK